MKQTTLFLRLRRLMAAAVLALAASFSFAADDQTVLHLLFTDGTSTWFLLDEKPVLTFTDSQLEVTSSTVSASYDFADILEYRFADLTTALQPLPEKAVRFVRTANDEVVVYGCKATAVALYDLAGRRLPASVSSQADAVRISLRALPAATYILHLNRQSIKLMKR